jgi:hypothetical protein
VDGDDACVPDCDPRECGLDPACPTRSCGTCPGSVTCNPAGHCQRFASGSTCSSSEECESRLCSDGICCLDVCPRCFGCAPGTGACVALDDGRACTGEGICGCCSGIQTYFRPGCRAGTCVPCATPGAEGCLDGCTERCGVACSEPSVCTPAGGCG